MPTPDASRASRPGGSSAAEADKAAAKLNLPLALHIAGLVENDSILCPVHRKVHDDEDTLKLDKGTGNWMCRSSGERGDSISLVREALDCSFPDAIHILNGRAPRGTTSRAWKAPSTLIELPDSKPKFVAEINLDVNDDCVNFFGEEGIAAAVEYWSRWHIAEGAVREMGSAVAIEPRKLERFLIKKYGIETLRACGLVTVTKNGRDMFLLNDEYNVIEPHRGASGRVRGMQFRASTSKMVEVKAHKDSKKAQKIAAAAGVEFEGERIKFVRPFLALKGAGPSSLVGFGHPALWRADPGAQVIWVEGGKDYLAGLTMGQTCFGLPGVSWRPTPEVAQVLRKHKNLIALDGDAAGRDGRDALVVDLRELGIDAEPVPMPPDLDVTDILVQKWAKTGCLCATCTAWRADHPEDNPGVL